MQKALGIDEANEYKEGLHLLADVSVCLSDMYGLRDEVRSHEVKIMYGGSTSHDVLWPLRRMLPKHDTWLAPATM
jgi:hypothetical protein